MEKLHLNRTMTLRIPHNTESVRLVIGSLVNGRIGSVELDHSAIDSAPDLPTPKPKLTLRARGSSLQ